MARGLTDSDKMSPRWNLAESKICSKIVYFITMEKCSRLAKRFHNISEKSRAWVIKLVDLAVYQLMFVLQK